MLGKRLDFILLATTIPTAFFPAYDSGRMDPDCIAAAKEALNGNKTVVYKNSTINMTKTLFFSRYIYRSKFRIAHHMFK